MVSNFFHIELQKTILYFLAVGGRAIIYYNYFRNLFGEKKLGRNSALGNSVA
jgi:hypothetical protein